MTSTTLLAERVHYYSTACLHTKHDQCKGDCKFCRRPCGCSCHTASADAGAETEEAMSTAFDPDQEPAEETLGDVAEESEDDETEVEPEALGERQG
jgi:hypothetical protein